MPITTIFTPISSTEAATLLKQATALKDAGKFDAAVAALKEAYSAIASTSIDFGVETFLRLPLYLQAAGRNDEAWREFNSSLRQGYPNQSTQPGARESNESKIYDKMRVFLQREGKSAIAVSYGVLSYIYELRSRYIGGQKDPVLMQYFRQYSTEDAYTSVLTKLLKKAKKMDKLHRLCELLADWLSRFPDGDDLSLEQSVARILNE